MLPAIVTPVSVFQQLIRANSPIADFQEDYWWLFGFVPNATIDGREMIVLTHFFQGPGRYRSFAHANGLDPKTKAFEQLINNCLTECAKAAGFLAAGTVGLFHLHPDAVDTCYSSDDRDTFKHHATITGSKFCLAPIGSRWNGKPYFRWFFYANEVVQVLPEQNINIIDDQELSEAYPGILNLLTVKPEHFLSNVRDGLLQDPIPETVTTVHAMSQPLPCPSGFEAFTKPTRLAPRMPGDDKVQKERRFSTVASVILVAASLSLMSFSGGYLFAAARKAPETISVSRPLATASAAPAPPAFHSTSSTSRPSVAGVKEKPLSPAKNVGSRPKATAKMAKKPAKHPKIAKPVIPGKGKGAMPTKLPEHKDPIKAAVTTKPHQPPSLPVQAPLSSAHAVIEKADGTKSLHQPDHVLITSTPKGGKHDVEIQTR